MHTTILSLAKRFNAEVLDNIDKPITHLCTLEEGDEGGIGFFSNPKYADALYKTHASAVFVPKAFEPNAYMNAILLKVDHPYACFCSLIEEIHQERVVAKAGIEFPSYIGEAVIVGPHIYRGAFSYIGNHVEIGKNVKIYPHVYIGDCVTIGDDTILYSGSKILSHTMIGNRCVIHAGAVIGSVGFGFVTDHTGAYKRIPSIGHVVLKDDVEIGANTTIDAGTVGKTSIGEGSKVDNLVQLAHNVQIGKHAGIAAQVGIAGSTKLGDYCRLGGQTGIAGHLSLGDHTTALGRAGITRSFKKNHLTLAGTPAFENKKFLASYACFKNLPHLLEKNNRDTFPKAN